MTRIRSDLEDLDEEGYQLVGSAPLLWRGKGGGVFVSWWVSPPALSHGPSPWPSSLPATPPDTCIDSHNTYVEENKVQQKIHNYPYRICKH